MARATRPLAVALKKRSREAPRAQGAAQKLRIGDGNARAAMGRT
jgi:hypothetical protein